jgi:hypothetical protein
MVPPSVLQELFWLVAGRWPPMTRRRRSCWRGIPVCGIDVGGPDQGRDLLPVTEGGWLPDGSRISYLNAPSGKKDDRLPVRVAVT